MPDREKVINGIECCEIKGDCTGCPYDVEQGLPACKQLAIEALALLKEQEPVKPDTENDGTPGDFACWWYVCGNCGRDIDPGDNYCRHCGRAVKWVES